jgi:hypothetical protein
MENRRFPMRRCLSRDYVKITIDHGSDFAWRGMTLLWVVRKFRTAGFRRWDAGGYMLRCGTGRPLAGLLRRGASGKPGSRHQDGKYSKNSDPARCIRCPFFGAIFLPTPFPINRRMGSPIFRFAGSMHGSGVTG